MAGRWNQRPTLTPALVSFLVGAHRVRWDLDYDQCSSEGMYGLGDGAGNGDVSIAGVIGLLVLDVAGTVVADTAALVGSAPLAGLRQHLYFRSEGSVDQKQAGQGPPLHVRRYVGNDTLTHSCSYIVVYTTQPGKHKVVTFDRPRDHPNHPTKDRVA